ncbi:MAG: hypothetical protein BWY80_01053 [Firmicutes bacterium ADurb.Bin456]|jgi:hypothetical protein|nr:MAG: hypothetical protein BWY80_01053 [Firmicutes bacterium ADurb.Bin456]
MNIRGRLNKIEREAWKQGINRKARRVRYVVSYGQAPGETGPPEIAYELEVTDSIPPGVKVIDYETKKTNEN